MTLHRSLLGGLMVVIVSSGVALAGSLYPPVTAQTSATAQDVAPAHEAPPAQATTPAPAAVEAANPAYEHAAPTIEQMVEKHAHDNGVPVALARAVIRIESRFNPRATNHGAMGLMQIKAGTARSRGFAGLASGLLSPDTNLQYGMKVLAEAYRATGGNLCETLAFYQSGHRVRRFSSAQRTYCTRARAYMAHA